MKKLAWAISRIFDPVIEIPILLSVATWFALTNGLRWRFLIFLLVVDALLPLFYLIYGLKKGKISDWDMTKREERQGIYIFTAIVHLIGVVYAYALGKTGLAGILLVFWSAAVIFALITTKWKISVHGGVNGAALSFFNHFWGWQYYWWLVIVLLLVLWSRVEIKKHSWAQVLVGASLAIVIVEVGLRLTG
ncbi:hypothetical protein HY333_00885 [Candidatus Collierbacteria bacterium]|nr:hypothetical protein [Candidatus Collierbacteria bacterium]